MDNFYNVNCPVKAPGLVIHGSASTLAKTGNAYALKANGILSAAISANVDMVALSASLGLNGGNSGTLADGSTRIYTFLGSIDKTTGAVTYSAVNGNDFVTASRAVKMSDINFGNAISDTNNYTTQDDKKSVIGFLIVSTAAAAFIPGTTALDAGTVTARYIDNYGFVGV